MMVLANFKNTTFKIENVYDMLLKAYIYIFYTGSFLFNSLLWKNIIRHFEDLLEIVVH